MTHSISHSQLDAHREALISVGSAIKFASTQIEPNEAPVILGHVLSKPAAWIYAHHDASLDITQNDTFERLVARRRLGEPVAYLTGMRGFWSLVVGVSADTLIPRADTERLVELALLRLPYDQPMRVADLGTGSGAVALALAKERPLISIVATDASEAALAVARTNAQRNNLINIDFKCGDWYAPLRHDRFDIIVSNPPYIANDDPHLNEGDLRFEPIVALASGTDGLDAIRDIVQAAPQHLHSGGWLLLEHGWQQGESLRELFKAAAFTEVATECDLEQRERVTLGRLS